MKFLDKALEISYQLAPFSNEKYVHTCFLFNRNKLIAMGQNNSEKVNAKAYYFGKRFNVPQFVEHAFRHAEIDCIARLWGKRMITGKETLVVLRVGKSGRLLPSLPCKNCRIVLNALGFTEVYHSIFGTIIKSEIVLGDKNVC